MINEDQKPEVEVEINERDFTIKFWQLMMKRLPKLKDYEFSPSINTTTNEITPFQIKFKDEKIYFTFPLSSAHMFWENIFQNLFYSLSRNLIIFERFWKIKESYKQEITVTYINHISLIFEYTKDNKKFLIKITHLNYFKPILESTRFLFIHKTIMNSKQTNYEIQATRFFERNLEISNDSINRYHCNKITIEEVLNIERFFEDLNKNLPFCTLIQELSNREPPFDCFLDYGGNQGSMNSFFSLIPFSKNEFSVNFTSKYIKLNLEFRNIVADLVNSKNKFVCSALFKFEQRTIVFDFTRIIIQTPKLNSQTIECGENLIEFEYEGYDKLVENLLSVLKYIKIQIFINFLRSKIENLKKPDFRIEEFDGRRIKIKIDKNDVFITFSDKPELYGFIEKFENFPEVYENYLNSLTKLNYEPNENNYRVELEQHFSRIFELLYLKSRYEQDRKRNIFKGISIIEVIMSNHHKICSSRGDIKLEFEIQINEQNDEILNFKIFLIKKTKKNEVKDIGLKVKSGMIYLTSSEKGLPNPNEENMLMSEIHEIYEKFINV